MHISPQEADNFKYNSLRLSEIENQLLKISNKKELSDQEVELINSLQSEKTLIENWFKATSK